MRGRTVPARPVEPPTPQPVEPTTLADLLATRELGDLLEPPVAEGEAVEAAVEEVATPEPLPFHPIIIHWGANRHARRARKHQRLADEESTQRLDKWHATPNFTIRRRVGV